MIETIAKCGRWARSGQEGAASRRSKRKEEENGWKQAEGDLSLARKETREFLKSPVHPISLDRRGREKRRQLNFGDFIEETRWKVRSMPRHRRCSKDKIVRARY